MAHLYSAEQELSICTFSEPSDRIAFWTCSGTHVENKGKWGKVRAAAWLAVVGFIGSVGQYTIQNSKLPDWLSNLFGLIGTTFDSLITVFMVTTLPLWLIAAIGFLLALTLWVLLFHYNNNYESLLTKNKELLKKHSELENIIDSLKLDNIRLENLHNTVQRLFMETHIKLRTLEESKRFKSINAELKQDQATPKSQNLSLKAEPPAPLQQKTNILKTDIIDSADISPTAIHAVQAFISQSSTKGSACSTLSISEALAYTPATVQSAVNSLLKRKLIMEKQAPSGKIYYSST